MICSTLAMQYILCTHDVTGGTNTGKVSIGEGLISSGDMASILNGEGGINDTLGDICQAIGAIMFAMAIYKLIMSMKDSSAADKAQAAALFGGGIGAFMINTILNNIGLEHVADGSNSMAMFLQTILTEMSSIMMVTGVVLLAIGVFQMIMSFMNEQAAEKENSSRLMAVGAALIASKSVMMEISNQFTDAVTNNSVSPFVHIAADVLTGFAKVSGAILLANSIYQMVMAFKDEDLQGKHHAALMMAVSAALLSFGVIVNEFLPGFVETTTSMVIPVAGGVRV